MTGTKHSKAVVSIALAVLMVAAFMPAVTYSSFAATAKKAKSIKQVYHKSTKTKTVTKGKSWTLKYKLSPSKLTWAAQQTTWKTSNSKIVTVKKLSGNRAKVYFKKAGSAYVKVYCKNNKRVQTKWKFKVVNHKPATSNKTTNLQSVSLQAPNAAEPATTLHVGTTLTASTTPAASEGYKVSYKWLADGTVIPGATKSSFKVTSDQIGKKITVSATSKNTVTSSETATVAPVTISNLKIALPDNQSSVNVGTQLKLDANATNASNLKDVATIQWYRVGKSANGSEQQTEISGANDVTYTATKADIGYKLAVKVTPNNGVTLNGTNLVVQDKEVTGNIAVDVQANGTHVTSVTVGTQLTAVVTPSDAKVTYQWYIVNGDRTLPISNATSATYTPSSNGTYYVAVTLNNDHSYMVDGKASGTLESNRVSVGSSSFANNDVTAVDKTNSDHVLPGDQIEVKAPVLGGYATISAQLYKDNAAVGNPGTGTTVTLTIPSNAKPGDVYSIKVNGTGNYAGTSYTLTKTFRVEGYGDLSKATVTQTSDNVGITLGQVKLNDKTLTAGSDYTVQWYRTSYNGVPGTAIAGATGTSYRFSSGDINNTYVYAVITGVSGQYVGSKTTDGVFYTTSNNK